MPNITAFDTSAHHIRFIGSVTVADSVTYEFRAILDTGAPRTEFSDQFLQAIGMIPASDQTVSIKEGLQTEKYGKLIIPTIEILSHQITNLPVHISHFQKDWGVDALIGLDFFRRFEVTVNYAKGLITTERLQMVV